MLRKNALQYAPRAIFEQILEYAVIPTFDLVVEYGDKGVVIVRRRIAPYMNVWALPGLRMVKPESIEDTIERIGMDELGLRVNAFDRLFLGQYVGRFQSEHKRQDLSTGFLVKASANQTLQPNSDHFSSVKVIRALPSRLRLGAMYRYYLTTYFRSARL